MFPVVTRCPHDSQTKVITSQRSVDLLHVAQDLLSQHMNQPGDDLRVSPLDGVEGSLRKLGQLRVPDSVDGGGSVHVCQRLHLLKPKKRCQRKTSSVFSTLLLSFFQAHTR